MALAAIQKIGNSKGVRIPKKMLDITNLKENDMVELIEVDGGILIKKAVPTYKNLDELFENYEGSRNCGEWDFGEDMGREAVW